MDINSEESQVQGSWSIEMTDINSEESQVQITMPLELDKPLSIVSMYCPIYIVYNSTWFIFWSSLISNHSDVRGMKCQLPRTELSSISKK